MFYSKTGFIGTIEFWMFFFAIIPLSIPFKWISNNTNRSTLSVDYFHAMVNFAGEIILLSVEAKTYCTIWWWYVAAVVITFIWGAKTMTGK